MSSSFFIEGGLRAALAEGIGLASQARLRFDASRFLAGKLYGPWTAALRLRHRNFVASAGTRRSRSTVHSGPGVGRFFVAGSNVCSTDNSRNTNDLSHRDHRRRRHRPRGRRRGREVRRRDRRRLRGRRRSTSGGSATCATAWCSPDEDLEAIRGLDAVLLGAVGTARRAGRASSSAGSSCACASSSTST